MNLDGLRQFETPSFDGHRTSSYSLADHRRSLHHLREHSLSSTPSENDWLSPFTLPPLPSLRRDRDHPDKFRSPESLRQRDGSGAYYAAAWGSPYATPSPRRTPQPAEPANLRQIFEDTPLPSSYRGSGAFLTPGEEAGSVKVRPRRRPRSEDTPIPVSENLRNPRSERPNWLSDSEDSGSETGQKEADNTPTRVAYLDNWGASPAESGNRSPIKHRSTESLATVTQDTFHVADSLFIASQRQRTPLPLFGQSKMADRGHEDIATPEKALPILPRQTSHPYDDENTPKSPTISARPQPTSMQSYQRPKKKVIWKGKACVIALPLTDREAAGLPPVMKPEDVKERIAEWIAAGYSVNGFELTNLRSQDFGASNGQSRSIYPDSTDMNAERKPRQFQVQIPNQAEWESWVSYLKEEKLRALGVSPSSSEAPPSTRSPFSPPMSRVSSTVYPGLAASPPIAPSSSASNPLRATSNPFSPSLMSSAGISPQPGSVVSSQFNGPQKNVHGYKPSVAHPPFPGRVSPYEPTLSSNGARPNIQPLSSRQNSFSPNHPLQHPNLGEVLSQPMHVRAPTMQYVGEQPRPNATQQRGHAHSQQASQHIASPALPQRLDSQVHTPQYSESSRTPIEIAHPTPKSHRHNLSMALQREIDEAEAALHAKHDSFHAEDSENLDLISGKDESMNEEPPILRRPETITPSDERSDVETNPSLAATPMLMDDKNPFVNWQALSDAATADAKSGAEPGATASRFNVKAREFDPRAGFSSSNFSFGGSGSLPFGPGSSKPAPAAERPPARNMFSASYLNADAPAFTPLLIPEDAPTETPFRFSAATFNVAAPVFNPSQSPGTNFKHGVTTVGSNVLGATNSIFGNVVIDPGSKVNRRVSKAAPVIASKSKEAEEPGSQSEYESQSDDDEGRPMAPAERQKRARRHDSDGDRSPVYADSAPFSHRRILSEIVDAGEGDGREPESPGKPIDGWAYIPADEAELTGNASTSSPNELVVVTEMDEAGTTFTFTNQDDAAMFNEARPPLGVDQTPDTELDVDPFTLEKEKENTVEVFEDVPQIPGREARSSLSAHAQPFDFNPRVSRSSASAFTAQHKSQGLEASRYADVSDPPTRLTASLSSPPADLPHYIEKHHESVNDAEDTVEVFEETDKSTEDDIVEVIEEDSTDDDADISRQFSEPTKELDVQLQLEEEDSDMPGPSLRHHDHPVPSFEEIDAVMKHLEDHPELGVERNDTPIQTTPFVDAHRAGNFRSDAPSPSPRRLHDNRTAQGDVSYPPSYGLGIGVHNLNPGRDDVSDWGDALPSPEAAKLQLRSQFFDGHVNDLVDGLLENRLGPLERSLEVIQQSLALMAPRPKSKKDRRSLSTEKKESDADDEDGYDAFEGFSSYRDRSPMARRGERRNDLIRAAVAEALAAHQAPLQPQPSVDMTEVNAVLLEMRQLAQQSDSQNTQTELKTIMEDVISHHPRLRGSRVREDHEGAALKLKPQIDGLESMLKISQEHAAEEARLRRKAEEDINELKLRLRIAEEETAQYRESSEEAQNALEAFVEEKDSYKNLERESEGLTLRNTALENTLEEYRVSSDQWREDIRNERTNNQDLKRTLQELHQQLQEQRQSRQGLRSKIEHVQSQMTQVIHDMHGEQEDWRNKEHSLQSKLALAQDALDQERRHREKAEMELDNLDKEHKANLHLKTALEQTRVDVSRLDELNAALREENRALDTKAFNLDRELAHVTNSKDAELAMSLVKPHADLDRALSQLQTIRTDSEAQTTQLQSLLDQTGLDQDQQKAKHDSLFAETIEAHQQALREANVRKETALADQHQDHEKKLKELHDRHARELHNSLDTRTRLEHHFNERSDLSDDKVQHLESKIMDLEDRLAITKSAARAAVEAATAKGVNLPTPASSVVASPPQRVASASLSFAKGSEVPEKISPQALRESIMVLQDQLQNREQKIEQLEAELAAVDKDAPVRVKERDTEISWLRELLSVRVDDLEDITNALSKPDFDREAVKDAAIRVRANLQMEQQLKERAAGGMTTSFPSISSLSTYAQSPRALPMAAAAAWGNWRKARDSSIGALSDLAANLGNQTPSRSTRPANLLSDIITPPTTSQKTPSSKNTPLQAPPSMRPLSAAASRKSGGPEARPLRAFNSQPRALSSREAEKRPESSQSQYISSPPTQLKVEPPRTPTQVKNQLSFDLTDDVDDDASPLDGKHTGHLEYEEPIAE